MSEPRSTRHLALGKKLRAQIPAASPSTSPATMFWGVVDSVSTGPPATVAVLISGSSLSTPGLRHDASYTPTEGDTCWGLKVDGDYFVIGKRA